MRYGTSRHSPGFTIVELLIVIIVIGILSTLVLIGYGSIQDKAYNTATIFGAGEYRKAIMAYAAVNGDYPYFDRSVGGVCLGIGYEDIVNNDGIGDCGETNYYLSENSQFNNSLETVANGLPPVSTRKVRMPYQSDSWVGAAFHYYPPFPPGSSQATAQTQDGFTVNGVSNPYYIMYVLANGNTNCGLPVVVPDSSQGGWPRMKSDVTQGYSWSDGNTTACVVGMLTLGS